MNRVGKLSVTLFALFFLVGAPVLASANTVLRIGNDISVSADQVVEGDYYVSVGITGNTSMSGTVTEDMYVAGGSVTANGVVGGDVFALTGVANMHASVTDDVRLVTGEATVGNHIGGDLFVIGASLTVLSTAVIEGDVVFFGGEAQINGDVKGSIMGNAGQMRIDSSVGGDVDVEVTSGLTLGGAANIAGDVRYTSMVGLVRAQDSIVVGEVVQNQVGSEHTYSDEIREAVVPFFVVLFATLSVYLLFRKELASLIRNIDREFLKSALVGGGAILLLPILSVILLLTVLGMLVGLMGMGASLTLYIAGISISGIVVGAYLAKLFAGVPQVSLLWSIIGTVVFYAMTFLPFVGPIVALVVVSVTVGGLVLAVYRHLS